MPNKYLVQLFIPGFDVGGTRFEGSYFRLVHEELLENFSGLTAYTKAPATGVWAPAEGEVELDEMVVFEVMVEEVDRQWWKEYREKLEMRFAQEQILVRVLPMEQI